MAKRRANGEGSIFQRKDGLWAAVYTDNIGKRRTLYGKTQQIVRLKLKEAIKQSDLGIAMDKGKITFVEWLVEWLEVYERPTVRENTYASMYGRIHNHIIPEFPKVLLKDLRTDMLQKYMNKKSQNGRLDKIKDPNTGELVTREGGLSPNMLLKLKQVISMALEQAVENNIIQTNAAKKVKLPKMRCDEVEILGIEEQKKLEEAVALHNNPLSFAIFLDLYTGLRIGELIALKISDIDFEKKEMYVRRSMNRVVIPGTGTTKIVTNEPKTEKGRRTIPLSDFIVYMLKDHIVRRNEAVQALKSSWKNKEGNEWVDNDFVFVSLCGTPPEQTHMRKILDRLLREAGVKHVKFHALRHTFTTRCLEAGFDIKSLSDILGHTDAKMTLNTYAHALPNQKRANMDKLTMLSEFEEAPDKI